jgi:general secretion pathway protein A
MDTSLHETPDPITAFEAESGSGARTGLLTYEPYYGLLDKPFSLSTSPRSLYKSESHAPVFHDLLHAIRRREGLIVLTGDIGTGKTTLCRSVLAHLDRKTFTTFVPDPFLTREDLLKMLLVEFGVVSVDEVVRGRLAGASRPELSYPLYDFLNALEPIDAFAVLIIDEAQNLGLPLLEEIRILSDLEERGRKLLQVVLVGQPEFRADLKLARMRQVEQRVSMHCELQPLTRDGVYGYVEHRLVAVGGTRDRVSFSADALDLVFDISGGVPRVINLLCDRALHHGSLVKTARVGVSMVEQAAVDLKLRDRNVETTPAMPSPSTMPSHAEAQFADVSHSITAAGCTDAASVGAVRTQVADAPEARAVDAHVAGAGAGEARPGAPPPDLDMAALLDMPVVGARPGLAVGVVARPVPSTRHVLRTVGRRASDRRAAPPRGADESHDGRVPSPFAVIALTALGVMAGIGLVVYILWMRPLIANRVTLPVVPPAGRSLGPSPGAAEPPTLPAPDARPVDELPPLAPATALAAAPATAPAGAPAAGAPGTAWVVQAGAFGRQARADALVEHFLAERLTAFVREIQHRRLGPLRVVFLGPYPTADEAERVRARVRQTPGLDDAHVRPDDVSR